jgi:hypothetical protein
MGVTLYMEFAFENIYMTYLHVLEFALNIK